MKRRLAVNAALNVLTGVSSAVFAFAVPVLLGHRVDATDLAIWSVILQTAAYVAPFTLGIQSVLSRHIAIANERAGDSARGSLTTMTAALRMLWGAAAVYFLLGLAATFWLDRIYPALPAERLADTRIAFALYVAGQATLIPAAALAGYFFGMQRNLIVTLNVLCSKLIASAVIVSSADMHSLPLTSALATLVTVAFSLALYWRYRFATRTLRAGPPLPVPSRAHRQLVAECLPISVWALATFLIYGGTSSAASWVDFNGFPAYAMASGATMLLLGLHSAAFGPFIPYMAVVSDRWGGGAVARSLTRASALSALISVATLAGFVLGGAAVVRLLVPQTYQASMTELMAILLFGNSVRLIGLPYANTLIALGLQGAILWTPVLEAAFTFGSALVLGLRHGLAGVAWGMAVGGSVSVLMHFLVNMRVTHGAVPAVRLTLFLVSAGPVALAWLAVAALYGFQ